MPSYHVLLLAFALCGAIDLQVNLVQGPVIGIQLEDGVVGFLGFERVSPCLVVQNPIRPAASWGAPLGRTAGDPLDQRKIRHGCPWVPSVLRATRLHVPHRDVRGLVRHFQPPPPHRSSVAASTSTSTSPPLQPLTDQLSSSSTAARLSKAAASCPSTTARASPPLVASLSSRQSAPHLSNILTMTATVSARSAI
jgi:hypothetical protein